MRIKREDIRKFPKWVQDHIRVALADTDANRQSDSATVPQRAYAVKEMATPVRICVHHIRHRAADLENLYTKHLIDGIVDSGLLQDDRQAIVSAFEHTQEIGEHEETIVLIQTEEKHGKEEKND